MSSSKEVVLQVTLQEQDQRQLYFNLVDWWKPAQYHLQQIKEISTIFSKVESNAMLYPFMMQVQLVVTLKSHFAL